MVGGWCGSCPLISLFKKPNVESSSFSDSGVACMKQTLPQRAVVNSGWNIKSSYLKSARRSQRQGETWEDSLLKEGNLTGWGPWCYRFSPESTWWCWTVRYQTEHPGLFGFRWLEIKGEQNLSCTPHELQRGCLILFIRPSQKLGWPLSCTCSGKIIRCPEESNRFAAEKSEQEISAADPYKR